MRHLPVVAILIFACSSNTSLGPKPTLPEINNPDFSVSPLREYYLTPNKLSDSYHVMEIEVSAPADIDSIAVWLADKPARSLTQHGNTFKATFDLSDIPPGTHQLVLGANGQSTGFYSHKWIQTHPLYVVVSTDWDDADNSESSYVRQQELHDEHPELILTHFIGPYTFTDPSVTEARTEEIVDWALGMKNNYDDEIGLHIHPYCNFVDDIGEILGGDEVPCRATPSTVYGTDVSGYTVMVSAYETEEMVKMFQASDQLFQQYGLPKPTSFRAGGWTADLSTLDAMAQTGYVADTSANNWRRMEEWEGIQSGVLYAWNQSNWATINDTSQPYYPSTTNILETGNDVIPVLEVPDNGILVDYVTTDEMNEIFDANWPTGTSLDSPRAYSIGYHPPNFSLNFKNRITDTLSYVDQFLASEGNGPVIYAKLSDLIKVWPTTSK